MKYLISFATQPGGNLKLHDRIVKFDGPITEAKVIEFREKHSQHHACPIVIISITKLDEP